MPHVLIAVAVLVSVLTVPTQASCIAIVEYTASTGDPAKANSSAIFRGFTQILFQQALNKDTPVVGWTFTCGEIIQGEKDLFEDVTQQFPGGSITDIEFGSITKANTQSVELSINTRDDIHIRLGFIGYKGRAAEGGGYRVGLPENVVVNDLDCSAEPILFRSERYVHRPLMAVAIRQSGIQLHYFPLEFKQLRYSGGLFASHALFAFKLFNTGPEAVDMAALVVEYWFDGDDLVDIFESSVHTQYQSACVLSSKGCPVMGVTVQRGLESVQGARYKAVISFTDAAGILPPNETSSSSSSTGDVFEAVMNITSTGIFSQLNVTEDYSFKNTRVQEERSSAFEHLIPRDYERNPYMPVYLDDHLIWGRPPVAGKTKINLSDIDEDGNFCYLKSDTIPQCGLKMRYCCRVPTIRNPDVNLTEEMPLKATERHIGSKKEEISMWMVGITMGASSAMLFLCVSVMYWQLVKRRQVDVPSSPEKSVALSVDQDMFGSLALSIQNTVQVTLKKPKL